MLVQNALNSATFVRSLFSCAVWSMMLTKNEYTLFFAKVELNIMNLCT